MIHTIASTIDPAGARSIVPRGPLLEWDSLARCMIPVAYPSDREPSELLRGDVMMGGPWGFRGDLHELRSSDRHERLRRATLAVLGYYDQDRPNFEAPGYRERVMRVEGLRLLGGYAVGASAHAACAPPKRQIWQFTSAGRYYDAGFLRTGAAPLTGVGNGGADGATYDAANASSALTYSAGWSGSLDAIGSAQAANNFLTCGGTAANWRLHSGSAWTALIVGQLTNVATLNMAIVSNRNSISTTALGANFIFLVASGYRFRAGNGSAAVLSDSHEVAGSLQDTFEGKFVWGVRLGSGALSSAVHTPGTIDTATVGETAAPSDTDAAAMNLCALTGGGSNLSGYLSIALFTQLNSAGYLQSMVDQSRSLARI